MPTPFDLTKEEKALLVFMLSQPKAVIQKWFKTITPELQDRALAAVEKNMISMLLQNPETFQPDPEILEATKLGEQRDREYSDMLSETDAILDLPLSDKDLCEANFVLKTFTLKG